MHGIVQVEANNRARDAARLMAEKGVGCLLVTLDGKSEGIITERDLVIKVLAGSVDSTKVLVSELMSTPLFTVSSDQTLKEAAELMVERGVEQLAVVDGGNLVGIITTGDLSKALGEMVGWGESFLSAASKIPKVSELAPRFKEGLRDKTSEIFASKRTLRKQFAREMALITGMVGRYPFLSIGTSLFVGIVLGGLLTTAISIYGLLALVTGFPFAFLYGVTLGVPVELSFAIVILLDCFVVYAIMTIMSGLSNHPGMRRLGFRKTGHKSKAKLPGFVKRLPPIPALVLITFLLAPWAAVAIAITLGISSRAATGAVAVGQLAAGALSLATYKGLLTAIGDPVLVTVISLVILFTITTLLTQIAKAKAE